jgi:hypothetical protein
MAMTQSETFAWLVERSNRLEAVEAQLTARAQEIEQVKAERDSSRTAERTISDAYLRVRQLLGAFNTKPGGTDRFEVTEQAIRDLKGRADAALVSRAPQQEQASNVTEVKPGLYVAKRSTSVFAPDTPAAPIPASAALQDLMASMNEWLGNSEGLLIEDVVEWRDRLAAALSRADQP